MTEAEFTSRKLLPALREAMPNAVCLKHCDLMSGGIPDLSVTRFDTGPYARTVWAEVKLTNRPGVMFKPLQVEMLKRLGGWYVVWNPRMRWAYLFRADELEKWSDHPLTFEALIEKMARFF